MNAAQRRRALAQHATAWLFVLVVLVAVPGLLGAVTR